MRRNIIPVGLLVLIAAGLSAIPAFAADVAGKWYTRLDSEPVITINKAERIHWTIPTAQKQ